MEIVDVHPRVAVCRGLLFGCDPPWTCLHLPPSRLEVGHPILGGPFTGPRGKVSHPAPPLLACRSFLQELVGGPHAWYSLLRLDLPADLLLPFLTRERPLLWCSLSAGTSGCLRRWSPPVIGASGTPTRGYGARVARCLARTPWFVRVGRGLVPCPSAQNGCWVGAGGVVSR